MALQFKVPSMMCSSCAASITKAVQGVDPAAQVTGDPDTKLVTVETRADEGAVKDAIVTAGFPVE